MTMALPTMDDAYAAGIASDAGVAAFANLCATKMPSRAKDARLTHIASLIVPEAELKSLQGSPQEKVRHLQLQVLCRLSQASLQKADPMHKTAKNTVYSLLSSMAMKMDSLAMMAPEHDDADAKSAFKTFVLDTLSSRFQSMLPKTFKWLFKTMEITQASEDELKNPKPSMVVARTQPDEPALDPGCSIAQVLQDRGSFASKDSSASRTLFQEVMLTSSQPKCLPVIPIVRKVVSAPTKHLTFSAGTMDTPSTSSGPSRTTMVLKTPERPKRPPMKKQLVCVASSPPLRKPPKKRLGTLMSSFK